MERAASCILFFLRFVVIRMVEEPLAEMAANRCTEKRTNTLNLDLELCVFLKTEEGQAETVYLQIALINISAVSATGKINIWRMGKIPRTNHIRAARQIAG